MDGTIPSAGSVLAMLSGGVAGVGPVAFAKGSEVGGQPPGDVRGLVSGSQHLQKLCGAEDVVELHEILSFLAVAIECAS